MQSNNMSQLIKRLFYFHPILLSFCLPFGSNYLSLIILSWCFISFFHINKDEFKKGLLNRKLQLCLLFFIITILSEIISNNKI